MSESCTNKILQGFTAIKLYGRPPSPTCSYISACIQLIHSIPLDSQDTKPQWETWRVSLSVSIECRGLVKHIVAAQFSCSKYAKFSPISVFGMETIERFHVSQRATSPLPEILRWDWSLAWFPWSYSPWLHVLWELMCFLKKKYGWINRVRQTQSRTERQSSWINSSSVFSQRKRAAHPPSSLPSNPRRCNKRWHVVKYRTFHYFTGLYLGV